MTSRWQWLLGVLTRQLWFRATLLSLLGVASALLSVVVAPYLPDGLSSKIGADSVGSILTIIASSMLAVTTFSLSTMVSAYGAATSSVTPRATKLLIQDTTTQNVLATFVGSFLYSLVALITLSTGAYGDRGRVVLFFTTILVILFIVVALLRWIDYLLRFGRVGETTALVEKAAADALRDRRQNQFLGGTELAHEPGESDGVPVYPEAIGYIQHVDVAALSDLAEQQALNIFLASAPGTFMDRGRPLCFVAGRVEAADIDDIRGAFTIDGDRSFDQDPRFGLAVLAEIASRALSPAVNDPGTAIDVIGRAIRVLSIWAETAEPPKPDHPLIHVPPILLADLFDDIFHPIARDGAGLVEVQIRLQKAFASLARMPDDRFRVEALRHAKDAMARAEATMTAEPDLFRVRRAAQWAN